jgi:hypothetical protein
MKIEDIILTCIKEHPGISGKEDCFLFGFKNKQFISNGRNEFASFYF